MRKKSVFSLKILSFVLALILAITAAAAAKEVVIFDDDASWDAGFYRNYPATAFVGITSREAKVGMFSLEARYAPNVWTGAELGRAPFSLVSMRKTGTLTFWVKGKTGKEGGLTVYVMDSDKDGNPYRTDVALSKYVKMSKEWQRVDIPLADFGDKGRYWDEPSQSFKNGMIDWSNIMEVSIDMSPTKSDGPIILWYDDIKFIDTYRSTKLQKKPVTEPIVLFKDDLCEGCSTAHYPAGSSEGEVVKYKAHTGTNAIKAVFDIRKYSGIEILGPESYDISQIRDTGAIEFWLKGRVNTPEFYVGLVNSRETGKPIVSDQAISKRITINNTEWQKVVIPLSEFPMQGSYWDDEKGTSIPGEFNWKDFFEIQIYSGPSWGGDTEFYIDDISILPVYIPDSSVLAKDIKELEALYAKINKVIKEAKSKGLAADTKKATRLYNEGLEEIDSAKANLDKKKNKEAFDLYKKAKENIEEAYGNTFESKKVESRGVWIQYWSLSSRDEIVRFCKELGDGNFNWVAIEGYLLGGYTIWPSKVGVQFDQFKGWDPLAVLIEEGKKNGLQVSLWTHVFRAGGNSPMFSLHPDWIEWEKPIKTFDPTITYWICPARKEYADFFNQICDELIDNYPDLAGIQYDYIRYPESPKRSCYYCRGLFMDQTGIDPWDPATVNDVEKWMKWNIWRENQVTEFVKTVSTHIREKSPKTMISAAVWPENNHGFLTNHVIQNWEKWVDNQWVDFLCPMEYATDTVGFERLVKGSLKRTKGKVYNYHGIGQYLLPSTFELLNQIKVVHDLDGDGTIFFAMNTLAPKWYNALTKGPYRNKALTPHYVSDNPADIQKLVERRKKKVVASAEGTDTSKISIIPLPEVKVPKTSNPPKIDGNLDDAAWKTAGVCDNYWYYNGSSKVEANYQTTTKVCYDDTNIYFGMYMKKGSNNYHEKEKDGGKIWEDDSIEIFFDPEAKNTFVQFGVNSLGYRFSTVGSVEFKTKAKKVDDGYILEIALPFSLIGRTPVSGEMWRANVCRSEYDQIVPHSNWSCTYGSFLTPSRFGKFVFK